MWDPDMHSEEDRLGNGLGRASPETALRVLHMPPPPTSAVPQGKASVPVSHHSRTATLQACTVALSGPRPGQDLPTPLWGAAELCAPFPARPTVVPPKLCQHAPELGPVPPVPPNVVHCTRQAGRCARMQSRTQAGTRGMAQPVMRAGCTVSGVAGEACRHAGALQCAPAGAAVAPAVAAWPGRAAHGPASLPRRLLSRSPALPRLGVQMYRLHHSQSKMYIRPWTCPGVCVGGCGVWGGGVGVWGGAGQQPQMCGRSQHVQALHSTAACCRHGCPHDSEMHGAKQMQQNMQAGMCKRVTKNAEAAQKGHPNSACCCPPCQKRPPHPHNAHAHPGFLPVACSTRWHGAVVPPAPAGHGCTGT